VYRDIMIVVDATNKLANNQLIKREGYEK